METQLFSLEHHIIRQCSHGHHYAAEHSGPASMLTLCLEDTLIALKALQNAQIDLGAYLTYFTPRFSDNNDVIGEHRGSDLLGVPPVPCSIVGCSLPSHPYIIKTTWPCTLFIIPETRGDTKEAFKKRQPPLVQLPLEFTIRSHSTACQPGLDEKMTEKTVQYRLIGRALYNATKTKSHYTGEFVIGNSLYIYNDLASGGVFSNAGPTEELKTSDRHVTLVAYHRVSEANVRASIYKYT